MAEATMDRREQLLERLNSMKEQATPRQRELIDRAMALRQQEPAPAQVPMVVPPQPPPTLGHNVGVMASGFNEGLSETIGLPVDIVNAGLAAVGLPMSETPFMGSKFLEKYLMPDAIEPQTAGERIGKRVGKEVGATVPFAAMTVGAQSLKIAEQGNAVIQGILKDLQAMPPAKLVAIEEGLAASGGLGAGLMRELFPSGGIWADFAGEVLGSLAPSSSLGLIRKAREAGAFLASKIGMKSEGDLKKDLGKKLTGLGREEQLAKGIDQAGDIQQEIPDFKPTTGQVSNEPGLIQAERAFERSSAKAAQASQSKKQDSQTAIRSYAEEHAPEGKLADLSTGIEAEQARRAALLEQGIARAQAQVEVQRGLVSQSTAKVIERTEQQMANADQRAADRLQVIGPKLTDQQAGAVLREEYQKELDAAQAMLDEKWKKVDRTIPLPATDTRAAVNDVRSMIRTQEADEFVPSGALADLEKLGIERTTVQVAPMSKASHVVEKAVPVPFGELDAARRRLQGEIRAAKNDTLKARLTTLLRGVEQDLDKLADDATIKSTYPEQAAFYDDARQESFKTIQRLKAGQADKLRTLDKRGRFKTLDEEAVDLFLTGKASMEDFTKAIGNRPLAKIALQEAAKYDFYERAVEKGSGLVMPKAAHNWLASHEPMLKEFPELRSQFADATKAQELANDLRTQSKAILKDPEKMARITDPKAFDKLDTLDREAARLVKAATTSKAEWERGYLADFMGKDAGRIAEKIVRAGKPASEVEKVMSFIKGDEAAVRGFQREMWDASLAHFESKSLDAVGRPVLQARRLREFLAENRDWMEPLFGKARLARLDTAGKAMEMLERTGRPVLAGGSDTAVNLQTSLSELGPFLSRLYAEQRGIISLKWILGERAARALGKHFQKVTSEQAEKLLEEAFFDPAVAHTLMLAAQDGHSPTVTKALRTHLLNMNQGDPTQDDR